MLGEFLEIVVVVAAVCPVFVDVSETGDDGKTGAHGACRVVCVFLGQGERAGEQAGQQEKEQSG